MKLTFLAHCYRDELLAIRLVSDLQRLYPGERIVLIADGEMQTEYQQRFEDFVAAGLDLYVGDRLKLMEHGGAFVERYLRYFLNTQGDILIKLDPDTKIHREFQFSGTEEFDWFGTISHHNFTSPYCRGGCWAMTRQAVQRLLESGLLRQEKYKTIPYGYQRYVKFRHPWEELRSEFISHEDFILGDVAAATDLKLGDWQEVYIMFRQGLPEDAHERWAASHPHPYPG